MMTVSCRANDSLKRSDMSENLRIEKESTIHSCNDLSKAMSIGRCKLG